MKCAKKLQMASYNIKKNWNSFHSYTYKLATQPVCMRGKRTVGQFFFASFETVRAMAVYGAACFLLERF